MVTSVRPWADAATRVNHRPSQQSSALAEVLASRRDPPAAPPIEARDESDAPTARIFEVECLYECSASEADVRVLRTWLRGSRLVTYANAGVVPGGFEVLVRLLAFSEPEAAMVACLRIEHVAALAGVLGPSARAAAIHVG